MVKKLILKDGEKPATYELTSILFHNESCLGAEPVRIYSSLTPIDGHFIVYFTQPQDEFVINQVVGVAHFGGELPEKVYQCALETGERYARHLKCEFVDETSRARERELVRKRIG